MKTPAYFGPFLAPLLVVIFGDQFWRLGLAPTEIEEPNFSKGEVLAGVQRRVSVAETLWFQRSWNDLGRNLIGRDDE